MHLKRILLQCYSCVAIFTLQICILNSSPQYDYIITGAGCAGLSLAVHMILSGKLNDKKVLIIDQELKDKNDRTWSFWETGEGLFESIVYRQWKKTWFHSRYLSRLMDLDSYRYKMIRGIDFYNYCLSLVRQQPNFIIRPGTVKGISNGTGYATVNIDDEILTSGFVFNSILFEKPVLKKKEHYLLQHFKGWIIETAKPVFNPEEATLMDFRTGQEKGATFVYVKPFSPTKALVEYTLFTENLLQPKEYEEGLRNYIARYVTTGAYSVVEEENGIIPMTNYRFPAVDGRIVNIGTAGGQTKASSGYTFQFIQKHSARLVESLIKKENPFIARPGGPRRFHFYDSTLLHILKYKKVPGDKIFTQLFKKNKPQRVLRFLDNESSLGDELRIISSLPTWPFLIAALKQV